MRCERCGGLQLRSHFASVQSSAGAWEYDAWHCLNCGDVVDPLILQNRHKQPAEDGTHRVRPFGTKVMWLRPRHDAVA
jgi:phage major head subunit gpT-like protein